MCENAERLPEVASRPSVPWLAVVVIFIGAYACAIYANLSFTVNRPADFRYFPPFEAGVDGNRNRLLGSEYFSIAQALAAGEGFANPFKEKTGPTAWMPPILPALMAALLWVSDGDRDFVLIVIVFLQTHVLIATGVLIVALARQTCPRLGTALPVAVFFMGLMADFRLWFQYNHDSWLVLLSLDLLIAALCWLDPLRRWQRAVAWGVFGGVCALINPVVTMSWGMLSLPAAFRQGAWTRFGISVLVATITLTPWIIRNHWVLGRWIPVKSNLFYELYQSQCLQADGLIQSTTFQLHPYGSANRERQEYKALGEMDYVDQKAVHFREAVWAAPLDFLHRVAWRFLGVTLWYVPLDRADVARYPLMMWTSRFIYPVPFLALTFLVATSFRHRFSAIQWTIIGLYGLYLAPYIVIGYYERYALPLLGVKVMLLLWVIDRLVRSNPASRLAARSVCTVLSYY
jgi:hypothetical protein